MSKKKIKVALIRPPKIQGAIEESMVQHPINLCYIGAYLQKAGMEAEIWDFEVERLSSSTLKAKLEAFEPDAVGITSMTTNIVSAASISKTIKSIKPAIKIAVGGPHSSALPERTLEEFPDIDAAIYGEGEVTAQEVFQRWGDGNDLEGVAGAAHRLGEKIVLEPPRPYIEEMDTLPFPARELLNLELYKGVSTPGLDATLHQGTVIFTSRGCPEKCIFCAANMTFGRRVRFRSAKNVLDEMQECMDRFGYNHFTIEDDTFTLKPKRLEELCEGIRRMGVTWDCDTRTDAVNRDMLMMMARSRCRKVAFGVESGSERVLKKIKKNVNIEQVKDAFRWAKEAGMITTAFFMIGSHPSETLTEVEMSLKLMKELRTDLMALSIAVPHPGTELFDIMKADGMIFDENWEKFNYLHSMPSWRTEHFTPAELVSLQNSVYRRFFMSPWFIRMTLKKALSVKGFKYYTSSAIRILKYLFVEKRD